MKDQIEALKRQLLYHDKLYYQDSTPEISDCEYDYLKQQLKKLLGKDGAAIGFAPSSKFVKVKHNYPMLSLQNIFHEDEVEDFIEKTKRYISVEDLNIDIICEPKIDGVSFSLKYIEGLLYKGVTRGNGHLGEDITPNILSIEKIPCKILSVEEEVEIRGEIYIDKDTFLTMNGFTSARNAASGSIRQLDPEITRSRNLKYNVYQIYGKHFNTHESMLNFLKELGFYVVPYLKVNSISQILEYYHDTLRKKDLIPYDVDGVVYKFNDIALQKRLGEMRSYPRWAIAHKFPSIEGITKINSITMQVGRTGVITPVAELDPIKIGGVMMKRANLHNIKEIIRKDIREGDMVLVKRAGDVIPHIEKKISGDLSNPKFCIPVVCPICKSKLVQESITLRCTGEFVCDAQLIQKVIHMVSRDALNIRSLGKKHIEFLFKSGFIKQASDIFSLSDHSEALVMKAGWGDKLLNNIITSIENAISYVALDRFIFSLGIRYIGINTSKILAEHYVSYSNWSLKMLNSDSELRDIDGIGKNMIDSLFGFFKEFFAEINKIAGIINIIDYQCAQTSGQMSNAIVVFTGKLSNMSRAEAKDKIVKLGGRVKTQVTSKTRFLIVGESPGSKLLEAKKWSVKILTESEFASLIKLDYT